jgi:8-oxo-dGTP pyrophosphatase MutT (NUDIX family)
MTLAVDAEGRENAGTAADVDAVVDTVPPEAAEAPERRYRAAGGVVVAGGQVLLLFGSGKRRAEVRLPKGHVEPGETSEECALREVQEETGLRHPRVARLLGTLENRFFHKGRRTTRRETWYLMAAESDDTAQIAMGAAEPQYAPRWRPLAEAEALLTYEPERLVVRWAVAALTPVPTPRPAG